MIFRLRKASGGSTLRGGYVLRDDATERSTEGGQSSTSIEGAVRSSSIEGSVTSATSIEGTIR